MSNSKRIMGVCAAVGLAVGLYVFAAYVWPTKWAVYPIPNRSPRRVNRFTGETQTLYDVGWKAENPVYAK